MTQIVGASVGAPPSFLSAEQSKIDLAELLPERASARLARLVDESRIATRHVVAPVAELARMRTMGERDTEFVKHAVPLGASVARRTLDEARISPMEVSALVFVSSTSFMVPSLDSLLIRELGLPPHVRRIPINQLGCSGGVGAIGLAAELAGAEPSRNVLVVCVEIPSLSLPVAEPSLTDLVACTLLADGAAAALVSGGERGRGPEVLATRSLLFPEAREGGGARLTEAGFRMVQAVGLPRLARERLYGAVGEFLAPHGLAPEDVAFWMVNPRSPQILEAIGDALRLDEAALAPSWAAWERNGNTISATIFFILDELRRSAPPVDGSPGLMLSFGAGVTCEMALLRWHDFPTAG